jgi:FAD/FMN-containing dehydrogenase
MPRKAKTLMGGYWMFAGIGKRSRSAHLANKLDRNLHDVDGKKPLIKEAKLRLDDQAVDFFHGVSRYVRCVATKPIEKRRTWQNHAGNQVVQPIWFAQPMRLHDIQALVKRAKEEGYKLKAIGSGHSFSDVAVTSDILVETHQLDRVLAKDCLKPTADERTLFHVETGMRISALNDALDIAGFCLANMGSYDAQTVIGAISTGTHGSGITLGPIAESVVSIQIVAEDEKLYRIEPTEGVTDPAQFATEYPEAVLVQNDDWFYSVVVSMGCMGIVYSVMLRVLDKYWLSETREMCEWDEVRAKLDTPDHGRAWLAESRHTEILINPYTVAGKRSCIICRRELLSAPPSANDGSIDHRNVYSEFVAGVPGISEVFGFLFNGFPELTPRIIQSALETLKDKKFAAVSYKVLNIGRANDVLAFSAEIGYPLETYLAATDEILRLAQQALTVGQVYQTSPFSLRFTAPSKHYLAMQYGRETCMIEMPIIDGTFGAWETLDRFIHSGYKFQGRPHWGQSHKISGTNNFIQSMYPKFNTWLDVYNQLSPKHLFANSFTERCGITSPI